MMCTHFMYRHDLRVRLHLVCKETCVLLYIVMHHHYHHHEERFVTEMERGKSHSKNTVIWLCIYVLQRQKIQKGRTHYNYCIFTLYSVLSVEKRTYRSNITPKNDAIWLFSLQKQKVSNQRTYIGMHVKRNITRCKGSDIIHLTWFAWYWYM